MQRGSDKHGPRQDDAMAREVDSLLRSGHSGRVDESLQAEPAGDEQPDVDLVPDGSLAGGTPEGMSAEDVTGRAELAAALGRVWPADRDALVAVATDNNAREPVLRQLRSLPAGREFESLGEVWAALGHAVEEHRF